MIFKNAFIENLEFKNRINKFWLKVLKHPCANAKNALSLYCQKTQTPLIYYRQIFNFLNMNTLFKKAVTTGLDIALVAGAKLQEVVADIIEKGKTYQEKYKQEEEAQAESVQDPAAPAATTETPTETEEQDNTAKVNRWEEYEHRLRELVSTAVAKLNLIRNDQHQEIEARIANLEAKLSELAALVAESNQDNEKRQ